MRKIFLSIAALVLLSSPAVSQPASPKVVLNKTKQGLALAGYDPVSYFTNPAPLKGSLAFTASFQGGSYQFVSAENRDKFLAEPAKFAPQFGGYCGYGTSRDHLAPVDPEAYTIVNGRLILQNSKSVLALWRKDPEGNLKLADKFWPGLVEREGKPLP